MKKIFSKKLLKLYRDTTIHLPDKKFISWQFKRQLDYKMDWDNPTTFNQKIQWLKVNWHDSQATICADKYEVRKFVAEKSSNNILNELYDVFTDVDEININNLPESFVLKGTHGSAMNIICTNKHDVNWNKKFKEMDNWLKTNYYNGNREWVYKEIPPRIICEKLLISDDKEPLKDYKVFCFNGKPTYIQVDVERSKDHKKNIYDTKWNLIPCSYNYPNFEGEIAKPETLETMLHHAQELSADFPFARVDFYSIEKKIIFGEITFFPASGYGRFTPFEYDKILGSFLTLPK